MKKFNKSMAIASITVLAISFMTGCGSGLTPLHSGVRDTLENNAPSEMKTTTAADIGTTTLAAITTTTADTETSAAIAATTVTTTATTVTAAAETNTVTASVVTTASAAPDTVTALLPPVSPTYQNQFDRWAKDFQTDNPNLILRLNKVSWEDMPGLLTAQIQAGTTPDIAFIGSGGVPKYLSAGLLTEISKRMTSDMISDYDVSVLAYFKNSNGLYGLPAYMNVQSIGGDKAKLEAAGVDWKSVQQNGWTYDQFRQAIINGTVMSGGNVSYGFVFACSGVTAIDYFSIFSKCAGMPSPFTTDLKYAYTDKNTLKLLTDMKQMIDDGSMPDNLNAIDSNTRWNMFLTGQAMITGKGLAIFESLADQNSTKLNANDGSAAAGSVNTDYIVLPVPTFFGCPQQAQAAVDGYVCMTGNPAGADEHISNTVKAMYYLDSGERAAYTDAELYCDPICQSAAAVFREPAGKSKDNTNAIKLLMAQAAAPRPDIPADLGAKADMVMEDTIIPQLQSMLAGNASPEQVYDAIVTAAAAAFGADGIVRN